MKFHYFQISWFRDGVRSGVAWEFKAGGGAVVGDTDIRGVLSGNAVYGTQTTKTIPILRDIPYLLISSPNLTFI